MLKKLQAILEVFKKGKAVKNPAIWKSRAKLANAFTLLLGSVIGALALFGVDIGVSGEVIESIAAALAALWFTGFGVYNTVTNENKGLPTKSKDTRT